MVIYRHKDKYSISEMCRFFGVSRSGYYDYVKRMDIPHCVKLNFKDIDILKSKEVTVNDVDFVDDVHFVSDVVSLVFCGQTD